MESSSTGLTAGGTAFAPSTSTTTTELRLRAADRADVPFIVDAMVAESRRGHFLCDPDQPDELRGLWYQVETVVSTGTMPMPGARDGVGGRVVIAHAGDVPAGFGIVIEHLPGSWSDRAEIFALAVHPRARSRGLGRTLIRALAIQAESRCVYARCAPASAAMQSALRACGFIEGGRLMDGGVIMELHCFGF